jgi:hypothetical protein
MTRIKQNEMSKCRRVPARTNTQDVGALRFEQISDRVENRGHLGRGISASLSIAVNGCLAPSVFSVLKGCKSR